MHRTEFNSGVIDLVQASLMKPHNDSASMCRTKMHAFAEDMSICRCSTELVDAPATARSGLAGSAAIRKPRPVAAAPPQRPSAAPWLRRSAPSRQSHLRYEEPFEPYHYTVFVVATEGCHLFVVSRCADCTSQQRSARAAARRNSKTPFALNRRRISRQLWNAVCNIQAHLQARARQLRQPSACRPASAACPAAPC